jgi:hypothetical protein
VLLSDPKVGEFLKTQVVPSWEMVREVPKVTVNFGGGKKLERTITGNTVMYLCTPEGTVLDAWPGVYMPEDFLASIHASLRSLKDRAPSDKLAWHRERAASSPTLAGMARTSMGKAMVESPLLQVLQSAPRSELTGASRPSAVEGFESYAQSLTDLSKIPMRPEQAKRILAANLGPNATPEELGMEATRLDSKINIRAMRPAIHLWMAEQKELPTLAQGKQTLFKQVLHIDIDDPYLGLAGIVPPGTPR